MATCVAVYRKSDSRKSPTTMAHKYKTCQNVSCLLLRLKVHLEKDTIWLTLNKTPPPFNHRQLKHCQRTNINKTMLSPSPSSAFHTKFTIRREISIPS